MKNWLSIRMVHMRRVQQLRLRSHHHVGRIDGVRPDHRLYLHHADPPPIQSIRIGGIISLSCNVQSHNHYAFIIQIIRPTHSYKLGNFSIGTIQSTHEAATSSTAAICLTPSQRIISCTNAPVKYDPAKMAYTDSETTAKR